MSTTKGSWWKLQGIFLEPAETFRQIREKPNWLLPMLATILVAAVSSAVIVDRIGLETIIRNQFAGSARAQELSEEQVDALVEKAVEQPAMKILLYATPVMGPIFLVLVCASLFMLGLYLMAGEAKFAKVFSVNAHTFFFYYVVYSGLSLIVVLLAQEPESIDLQNPLYSNPGFVVSRKDSPALYSLMSSLDVITFYHMFLLGLGLSTVTERVSFRTALGVVCVFWLIFVLGKMGLAAAFG